MMPDYLRQPTPAEEPVGRVYAVTHHQKVTHWMVEGNPGMIQVVKRLFPGSTSYGRGKCKFPATKRAAADLNWIMLRYPLKVEDKAAWENNYNDAVKHVAHIQEFNKRPSKTVPPAEFTGELREFQKEGLSYLLGVERALLADEMGLGKTIEALAYIAAKKAYPAIIVVPPHLMRNWENEINRFLHLPSGGQMRMDCKNSPDAIHVIKGLTPYELPPANIYIIHYLLLRGWKTQLPEYNFQLVVFDEIQELRHTRTEKYSAASLLAQNAPACIGLSGTPIYNRGAEIWAVMNILEYHCLGDYDSFTREWCQGYGTDLVAHPEELGDYLRAEGLMLRRTKEQVLSELPPKNRVVQVVDFNKGQYGKLIQGAVDIAKSIDGIKDMFERGRLMRQAVNESRMAIGIAKAPYVTAFVKMLLDAGEKILLFAYHHAVFDTYHEELKDYRPVEITGRENTNEKAANVEAFMNGKTDLCMVSLRAAAGMNLQRASCVVFGELDWSPAVHTQAEDRAHRIGQKDSVLCYYLVAEEGTDETIQQYLGTKIQQFTGIMGDRCETQEDRSVAEQAATAHMTEIIAKLKQRY